MKYTWTPAQGNDVEHIVKMAESHFQNEIDLIFNPQPVVYSRNITLAVVNQFYNPLSELLSVRKDDTGKLLAYTWATHEVAAWSDDRMVTIRMAHVDLSLSAKVRISIVKDMLNLWETFAHLSRTPIICSTTMRKDQDGFLKLHQKHGYDVRGSYAYKKITLLTT
jgi:hypothetical protein